VAFNGNGGIAVVVGLNSLFGVLEIGRNEYSQDTLIIKRKIKYVDGGSIQRGIVWLKEY
jgi:hypothetical protein